MSPSTRRAWIEIPVPLPGLHVVPQVALHPEGVDRNSAVTNRSGLNMVALHPEGVDRNYLNYTISILTSQSPSTRRAWIEII